MKKFAQAIWSYIRHGLDILDLKELIGSLATASLLVALIRNMWDWWSNQDVVTQVFLGVAIFLFLLLIVLKIWSRIRPRAITQHQDAQSNNAQLIEVRRRTFEKGETVIIDGHSFDECTFKDCTLLYNGGPYHIGNNKLEGPKGTMTFFASTNDIVNNTTSLLHCFKLLKPTAITRIPKGS